MKTWLRSKDEIMEYPYTGVITRLVERGGMEEDDKITVYEGVMDEHMVTKEEGNTMQTASYIVSIPLTKDNEGKYIIPIKGDLITIDVMGIEFQLTVDNSDPSQLEGVSIYATRNKW